MPPVRAKQAKNRQHENDERPLSERSSPLEAGALGAGPQPAPGGVGLLLIDVINPFNFDGSKFLAPKARRAAKQIRALRDRADDLGVPVIYVNDNYALWTSGRAEIAAACAKASATAKAIGSMLQPRPHDYFVIKPRFSGFYATNLSVLLPQLNVTKLILTGFATDICIMFTAADAHMREYALWIPSDAVAGEDDDRSAWALHIMRNSMGAVTDPASGAMLPGWVAQVR